VRTLIGKGLFVFGDEDGNLADRTGESSARLQHCLGLAYGAGKLYVADTSNNKGKVCDWKTRSVRTLVGSHDAGDSDDPPRFYQPGGLSVAGSSLYVADSNNHRIRVVDLETLKVKTLSLTGLSAPRLAPRPPSFPNARTINVAAVQVPPGKMITVA